jgi:hypothetical protein
MVEDEMKQSKSMSVVAASAGELAKFLERVHGEISPSVPMSIGMDVRESIGMLRRASLHLQFAAASLAHEEGKE